MAKAAVLPETPELRDLVTKELAPEYTVKKTRGQHFRIISKATGEPVRDEDGQPITIAGTASDARAIKNERARFKRLGLLNTNGRPKRAVRQHARNPSPANEANRALGEERREKSRELLKDMAAWMDKLGGWELRGRRADIAAILTYLYPETYRMQMNAQAMLSNFTKGDGVTEPIRATLHSLNEMFQASEDPRGLYNDLIRQAKGIGSSMGPVKLKAGQEWPYTVELLDLSKLFPDFAYQRPIHEPFVRQLLLTFDERLVGVIDVSKRGPDSYAILDGLQRTEAMKQAGKTQAYCAIYEGMTIQEEAQFFFHKNKDRKGMSAYYGFRARALAGDPEAVAVDKILAEYDYKLGPLTDPMGTIGAVRAVEDVYMYDSTIRESCLHPTLNTINICFRGRKSSTDTEMIRGLGRFFRVYSDDEIMFDHWHEALTALGPMLVLGRARDFSGATEQRGHGRAMAATLVEIHNTGLGSKERLSLKRLEADVKPRRKSAGDEVA